MRLRAWPASSLLIRPGAERLQQAQQPVQGQHLGRRLLDTLERQLPACTGPSGGAARRRPRHERAVVEHAAHRQRLESGLAEQGRDLLALEVRSARGGCARAGTSRRARGRRLDPGAGRATRLRVLGRLTAPGEQPSVVAVPNAVARERGAVRPERVEVEEREPARREIGGNRPERGPQVRFRRQVVERVVEAGDEVEAPQQRQLAQVREDEPRVRRLAAASASIALEASTPTTSKPRSMNGMKLLRSACQVEQRASGEPVGARACSSM